LLLSSRENEISTMSKVQNQHTPMSYDKSSYSPAFSEK
jgi:hypothetical protein